MSERLLQKIAGQLSVRGPDGVGVRGEGGCVAWMRTGPAKQAERFLVPNQAGVRLVGGVSV